MAKAILEFDLPEEQYDHHVAVHATDLSAVIWELDQWLRSKVKYPNAGTSEEVLQAYQDARDQLWDLIHDRDLSAVVEG